MVSSVKDQFSFITVPDNPGNRISGAVPWGDGNVFWDFGDLFGTGRLVYTPPPDQPLTDHWEHWAFVNSAAGNFMKIYRNGLEVASKEGHGTFVPPVIPSDMVLGWAFNGDMDEFRIWNQARTAEEIYHDVYRRISRSESGLVRLFHFDEGAGITAVDSGPLNAPASFESNPLWVASTTPIGFPVSITLLATNVGTNSATLNGIANPNGHQNFVGFQWGNDSTYGQFKFVGDVGSDHTDKPVSVELTGLEPGTTYHLRLEGDNNLGGTRGVDQTFTTTSLYSFADAGLALQCAAGLYNPTAKERVRWDVWQDDAPGQVTVADAARLARKTVVLEPNP